MHANSYISPYGLFPSTSSQVHRYDTGIPNCYRHHPIIQIISSLQYSTKVLKFGILSQYRSLVRLASLHLKKDD